MKVKKVLVTGGAGFIGSNFIRLALKTKKWKITNYDLLLTGGRKENLNGIKNPKNYNFVKGDIANFNKFSKLVKKHDLVVNFAAQTHVDRSITNPHSFIHSNIVGLHSVLEAIRINKKPLLQVSTDEVYGSISKGKASENTILNPSSPYSASKACGDLLCNSYVITYGCNIALTRSANNYGPYQFPEKFIPTALLASLSGKKIPVYGKGINKRDWIYVDDNVRGLFKVIEKGKFNGDIYNIATGKEKTNNEIAKTITNATNGEGLKYVKDRPGHDMRYAVTTHKIKKLGWKQKVTFKEGIEKTINWYKENKWWWTPLA